ncbi:MAG: VWA domain-containing protein [Clostridia bacterium]|nr:VWA domain-containing protein [Clostridia bacterium]
MKKGLTELVFILDRSGSMGGLEQDTIGGFNNMLHKQKQTEGDAIVTTVLFDNRVEILHDRIPIAGVRPITEKEYYVRGATALLDAIGSTVEKTVAAERNTAEEYRAEKVIFVITTDGMENASREYDYHRVKKLIKHEQEKYGWEFLFLGANMDAVSEAARFGIHADRAATFVNDSQGQQLNYSVVSKTVAAMRACPNARMDASWKRDIERDHKMRGR